MSVNQDSGPRIRSWLHERLTERPDPYPILDEVLSQLPTTPQRRHRWWPFDRGARPLVPAADAAMSSRRFTMFSAVKFVVASVIVALSGGFLLAGVLTTPQADEMAPAAVTDSPDPSESAVRTDILPGVTLTVAEVEPGVERIITDGADHDLDETHPTYRYDMDGIAIAPDGTVWLSSSWHGADDEDSCSTSSFIWTLGQPGAYTCEQGLPGEVSATELLILADGTPLAIGLDPAGGIRFDGEQFVPDEGPMPRQMADGGLLLFIDGADLTDQLPEGQVASVDDLYAVWEPRWYGSEYLGDLHGWGVLEEFHSRLVWTGDHWCSLEEDSTPGYKGVSCQRGSEAGWTAGPETKYLTGTSINQLAAAPDGSVWVVGDYGEGPGGLYRITPELPAE